MSKNNIIKGTIILTLAGLATRILGFFYRVYLSNVLGAEKLGMYQLVFPIYGICFTLYAGGIQTAISKLIAAEQGRILSMPVFPPDSREMLASMESSQKQCRPNNMRKILSTGLLCSVSIALCLSFLLYNNAGLIAGRILLEPECASSLRVLSFVFPFCGITACINGYYFGLKKTGVPAATQLFEQIVRILSVYLIAMYFGKGDQSVTCELAVLGVVFGEIASNIYNIGSFFFTKNPGGPPTGEKVLKPLAKLSLPLMGNRLLINILHSFEAILIPSMLKKSGLSSSDALGIYGILTGMSIPFILFPSTITNSLATVLLPAISEANAGGNRKMIDHTTSISVKYSLIIGIFSTGVFMLFGESIGEVFFHNEMAGRFLVTLSWLCPFMYLTTTLGSIINGLGKTHLTFFNTVIGLSIRILFVLYLVPQKGIQGYLTGLLVSELSIGVLDCMAIYRTTHLSFDAVNWLVKPSIILLVLGYLLKQSYTFLASAWTVSAFVLLVAFCIVLLVLFLIFLLLTGIISTKDFKNRA